MGDPQRVDLAQIGQLLGVSVRQVRRWTRSTAFPERGPHGDWDREQVWEWAARHGDSTVARSVPPKFYPPAPEAAEYLGARPGPELGTGHRRASTVMTWRTRLGRVHLVWPHETAYMFPTVDPLCAIDDHAEDHGSEFEPTYLARVVDTDYARLGPWLNSALAATREEVYVRWADLHHLLGDRPPWWPLHLRDPELITSWQPGDAIRTALVPPYPDTTAWLRAAALEPGPTVVRTTLTWLAQYVHHQAYASVRRDEQMCAEMVDAGHLQQAARPLPIPDPGDPPPESERRAAWLELGDRDDELAYACLLAAQRLDGGKDLLHPRTNHITPAPGQPSQQWVSQLVPALRTVAHTYLTESHTTVLAYLRDEQTNAPVVKQQPPEDPGHIRYATALPYRLITTSRLDAVILENRELIWIRTADGAIHPAPVADYAGISYGYAGSGPSTLAHLIARLLNDITAPATNDIANAPPGLEALFEQPHPDGTVLTRNQLIHALNHGAA